MSPCNVQCCAIIELLEKIVHLRKSHTCLLIIENYVCMYVVKKRENVFATTWSLNHSSCLVYNSILENKTFSKKRSHTELIFVNMSNNWTVCMNCLINTIWGVVPREECVQPCTLSTQPVGTCLDPFWHLLCTEALEPDFKGGDDNIIQGNGSELLNEFSWWHFDCGFLESKSNFKSWLKSNLK